MSSTLVPEDTQGRLPADGAIPQIPWLPPVPQSPPEWFAWEQQLLEYRLRTIDAALHGADGLSAEQVRAREISRCDLSAAYFANVYGYIYEARPDEDDDRDGDLIPYIQYPFQIEVFAWLDERLTTKGATGDGIIQKARDMGLSNSVVFWLAHKWLFRRPFQARLLSRNERLVDQSLDTDSLFWKLDRFLLALPPWLFAAGAPGFDWTKHRLMLRLSNPATGNLISGESTQADAGRGGRATVILYDEAAFMDDFASIWSAGRASTRHRIAVSTVSTKKGMDLYNIVHGDEGYEQPAVLALPYTAHPLHDEEWFEAERARDSPQRFAQEVLMDWTAGAGEWVYPETHPYQPGHFPYVPHGGELIITMDDGYDDEFALVVLQYQHDSGRIRVLDSYQNKHQPIDFYGYLLRGVYTSQFHFGPREHEFMRQLAGKGPALYYGDAHGAKIEQIAGTSVFAHLAAKFGIQINYYIGLDSGTRLTFSHRRMELGKLLPLMDFNSTRGARSVLEALKKHRFKDPEDGQHMRDYREPLHSKWSHTVSALEYFAVQFELFRKTTLYGAGGIRYSGRRIEDGRLVAAQ
jgi:hypothetical protein